MKSFPRLIVLCFILALLPAVESQAQEAVTDGFKILGTTNLQPTQGLRYKVAFLNFHSNQLGEESTDSWLTFFEHELRFSPRYGRKYELLNRMTIERVAREELGEDHLEPLQIPRLSTLVAADYFVVLGDRLIERDWFWVARVYNGRSGAFVARADSLYRPYHLRWTVNTLMDKLHDIFQGQLEKARPDAPPTEILLAESVAKFKSISEDCANKRCVRHLDDFEWIKLYNPDFFTSLIRDPELLTSLLYEASKTLELARIDMLEDKPLEVSLKLENKLNKVTGRFETAQYLEYIGRAAMELDRVERAEQAFSDLLRLDPLSHAAQVGLIWVGKKRPKKETAEQSAQRLSKARISELWIAETLLECFDEPEENDGYWRTKEQIADLHLGAGNHIMANKALLDLLKRRFEKRFLDKILVPALFPEDRLKFKALMNQQGVEQNRFEVDILRKFAKLRLFEGNYKEAEQLLTGALQLAPRDEQLLHMAAWDAMLRKDQLGEAQRYIDKIPKRSRDPHFQALLMERMQRYDEAETIWQKTRWPDGWELEALLKRAGLYEKQRKMKKAVAVTTRANKIYSGREEFYFLLSDIYKAEQDLKLAMKMEAIGWQLAGKPYDFGNYRDHLMFDRYPKLVLPHPLVGWRENGGLESLGVLWIINGTPLKEEKTWRRHLNYLELYKKREADRIYREIKDVLGTRYHIVEKPEREMQIRTQLNVDSLVKQTEYSQHQLVELATAAEVDSIAIVTYSSDPDLGDELIDLKVMLYLFDGVSNAVYMTEAEESIPFFDIYRFNMTLVAVPILIFIITFLFFRRISQRIKRWANPLVEASEYIKSKEYHRAAALLDELGFKKDAASMWGHHHASKKQYPEALESFYTAGDFDNALIALRVCPDDPKIHNMGAEILFRKKEYDRAEAHYRKAGNFIGIARIYEIAGDTKKAARVMGQYYFENNNPIAAVDEYRKIEDWDRAGWVLFYHKDYEQAAKLFRKAGNKSMYKKCMSRLRPTEFE